MKAESGCNPYAANNKDNHRVCRGSFGLFQISCHDGKVFDPESNIRIAAQKRKTQGWRAWGVYKTGAYKRYM